jgi:uncharacterized metal-binding protein
MEKHALPLAYACAGCAGAGQTAFQVARQLDKDRKVDMSSLSGLAAGKAKFLSHTVGRNLVSIDGCPLACANSLLRKLGLEPKAAIGLHLFGVRKSEEIEDKERIAELAKSIHTEIQNLTENNDLVLKQ